MSPSSTAADDTVTVAERRDGSRSWGLPSVTPSVSRGSATRSSPARSSNRSAPAPPRTIPPSPSSTPPVRVSEPPRPSAPVALPSARLGRRRARCASLPHCATTAEASTVGRKGPGATWRPSSSSTTTSSLSEAPAPPCSSGRWMPSQPRSAISFQKEGRGAASASSSARLAARDPWVVSTPRTVAPSSWCSSVMAIGMLPPCGPCGEPGARAARPHDTTEPLRRAPSGRYDCAVR